MPTCKPAEVPQGYTLFGLYTGVPLTERTSGYNMVLPGPHHQSIAARCWRPLTMWMS